MTKTANDLLEKMLKTYRETGKTSYEGIAFQGTSKTVLNELENEDLIEQIPDILGTVQLTPRSIALSNKIGQK